MHMALFTKSCKQHATLPYIAYCNRNILLAARTELQIQKTKYLMEHKSNMHPFCTGAVIGRFTIQDQKHTGNIAVQNPTSDLLVYSLYIIPIENFIIFHNLLDHRQGIFYCVFHENEKKPKQPKQKLPNKVTNKRKDTEE